jgi:hypothetical protein
MSWRPHGTARGASVDPTGPRAWAYCDRCDSVTNHHRLSWQYDWRGPRLQNLRILVCDKCTDKPFEHFRPIILPVDPPPILNPRPGAVQQQMAGGAALGFDPAAPPAPPSSTFVPSLDFSDTRDSQYTEFVESD